MRYSTPQDSQSSSPHRSLCFSPRLPVQRPRKYDVCWQFVQGWNCPGVQMLILNFNPWAKFQTFRHLTPSSFRSIPTLNMFAPILRCWVWDRLSYSHFTRATLPTYTLCSEKKHPRTFSFMSPWMMCKFKQKLQWIYLRNGGFWQCRN